MIKTKDSLYIWHVAREYAGIAEAGGVKNVVCSLAEHSAKMGCIVTVFMPFYGCSTTNKLSFITNIQASIAEVECNGQKYFVEFAIAELKGVRIVFIKNQIFQEKQAVYTYTIEEEAKNPMHKRGSGHADAEIMNVVFQKAVIAFAQISGEVPDVIHCQDAHTALIPAFAYSSPQHAKLFQKTRFFVSIHNAGEGYRQQFASIESAYNLTGLPIQMLSMGLFNQKIEPFLVAACYAKLLTVSPWYAKELLMPDNAFSGGLSAVLAEKKIPIQGITNGIDVQRYLPLDKSKSLLPFEFNPAEADLQGKILCRNFLLEQINSPNKTKIDGLDIFGYIKQEKNDIYFGYHGRLVEQKGIDVLDEAIEKILSEKTCAKFIVIGHGDSKLEEKNIALSEKYPGQFIFIRGYNRSFVRLGTASFDFLILPSFFEPCGLEDFIGQIYATIPIAHAAGGLNKILDKKSGFLYSPNTSEVLYQKVKDMIKLKKNNSLLLTEIIKFAYDYVSDVYSWQNVMEKFYMPLYKGDQ